MNLLPRDDQNPDFMERTARFFRTEFENIFIVSLTFGVTFLGLLFHIGVSLFNLIKDVMRIK